jgi:hypothetical protein
VSPADRSRLRMPDLAGNVGPNVKVICECGAARNMLPAMGAGAAGR